MFSCVVWLRNVVSYLELQIANVSNEILRKIFRPTEDDVSGQFNNEELS